LLGFLIIISITAHASAQTPFFHGKTIRIAVDYLAGGRRGVGSPGEGSECAAARCRGTDESVNGQIDIRF
jgi:hypothetical protein